MDGHRGGVGGASVRGGGVRQPGIKTADDRGLTWARALHSFAQLRQNLQNQLLFEVPISCPFSNFESGNQTGGVVVLDRLKIGGRQVKLAQRLVLVGWKVWIVGAVGNLRHRYELEQRSHRRYRGGVGRVIVLPRQLGQYAVRRKLLQLRTAAVEGVDSSRHHGNRPARVREQPLDTALAGDQSEQQQTRIRSRL